MKRMRLQDISVKSFILTLNDTNALRSGVDMATALAPQCNPEMEITGLHPICN